MHIDSAIHTIRGEKVILDADLARIYGVSTKALNQAVKRNVDRFPPDFLIQLTRKEWTTLRSQFVTSKERRGGRQYLPVAFTEHGAVMAANILKTTRAVQMSVFVVRAFIKLREVSRATAIPQFRGHQGQMIPQFWGQMIPQFQGQMIPQFQGQMIPHFQGQIIPQSRGRMIPR